MLEVMIMQTANVMHTANISELRANIATYMKKANNGEAISITSGGEAIATLVAPIDQRKIAKAKLQALAESAVIGDIVTPCDESWVAVV
jgi:prevent-host-death family protein